MAKKKQGRPRPRKRVSVRDVPSATRQRQYDICLSFAGEDRAYVEKVAAALKRFGVAVFYDLHEQTALWGKDLYAHLDEIYRLSARFCMIFVSKHYAKKLWTNHERRSAQARAFLENNEYILPVRMDETEIPGILPTIGFLDAKRFAPRELARLVVEKLAAASSDARVPQTVSSEFQRILYESFDFHGFSSKQISAAAEGRWLIGQRGCWRGKMSNGKYILTNKTKLIATLNNLLTFRESAKKFVNLGEGRATVRVRLLPPHSEHTGGGLLFRGDATKSRYVAFYRRPGRAVSFCKVTDGRLQPIWLGELPEIDDADFCRLSVAGLGDRLELSVDSAIVFTYSDDTCAGPAVGTSVIGTGVFEFDDFAMYTRVRQ